MSLAAYGFFDDDLILIRALSFEGAFLWLPDCMSYRVEVTRCRRQRH
jgi:hypothetical protein